MLKESLKNILLLLNREVPTSKLVKRGLKVGKGFSRQQGCYIDPTHCYLINIGDNVTMSIRVTLMAHDASTKKFLGYTRIGQINIGDNVFISANTTILPDVSIGSNVVIGAGSVVTKDIPDNCVAAGVPAKVISTLEEFTEKNRQIMDSSAVFDASYRMSKNLSSDKIQEMIDKTTNAIAFID